MKRTLLGALLLLPIQAHAFNLQWPLACTLGETCFIQNFVDHDSSAGANDFTCNPSAYNGHDGTDIRLRNLAAMRAGVEVKAAADGVVLGTRNTIADNGVGPDRKARIAGKECGNGVNIQHAEGYRTQYCHMRQGSIRVHTGERVKAGDVLGMVGLSGQTEFPHLHLGVWKDKQVLDPFTSGPASTPCIGANQSAQLWATAVTYQPTALLNDGFAARAPDKTQMRDTPLALTTLPANAPALLYWVDVMNLRAGDSLTLNITAPDGSIFAQKTTPIEKPMATYFAFIGKKNSSGKLEAGEYVASVKLTRPQAPAPVISNTQRIRVE